MINLYSKECFGSKSDCRVVAHSRSGSGGGVGGNDKPLNRFCFGHAYAKTCNGATAAALSLHFWSTTARPRCTYSMRESCDLIKDRKFLTPQANRAAIFWQSFHLYTDYHMIFVTHTSSGN